MKKLYFFILLFCLGFSKTSNAQGVLDNVKITPGYICQVDSFSISMWVWVSSSPGRVDSINHFFRNDSLHLNGYVTGGPQGAPTKVLTTIKIPTPPLGQYTLYFKRFENGNTTPSPYETYTDSFSVCMGVLAIPKNKPKNQLAAEIYPNPVSDILTIQLPETKGQTITVALIDVTGKKVISQDLNPEALKHQLNIATLPAGIYILQLQSDNSFKSIKIIKQ